MISKSELLKEPLEVAREVLLGATLHSRVGRKLTVGRIVELELYMGECDRACHAFRGKTKRNAIMFGPAGRAYVYFVYGMHNMFNVVISDTGAPNAILIRALEPLEGIDTMRARRGVKDIRALCSGPAKLAVAMGITIKHNGIDLNGNKIWLEPAAAPIAPENISAGPRIGVDYAGADAKLPWRFAIKGNPFVSRK